MKFVPKKKIRVMGKRAQWMNKQAYKARSKYSLWKKFNESTGCGKDVNYCSALRKATKEVRTAKGNFEKKFDDGIKQDPKSFYSYKIKDNR